jgi:alkylation response protein AidB-like acyl-CoA dehydrogenase
LYVDYQFEAAEQAFREDLRDLIATHLRPDFPTIFSELDWPLEEMRGFVSILAERGLLTQAWPEEYGGRNASVWSQTVLSEEMWGHNEPRGPYYMGVNWIGPVLMQYGTEEQKRRHLPAIARAGEVWCQGFSEPDAGSDLASLQLSAARTGDGSFLLNGQKVWTSYALLADWCVLAARTSSEGRKQHGITIFLIPMDRPGIVVRPIPSMLGPHHLHEVFFTDVAATPEDVLGEVDGGWEVMTSGLKNERVGLARYARSDLILSELREHWREHPDDKNATLAERVAVSTVHCLVARLLNYRVVAGRLADVEDPLANPVARLASTTLDQEVADLAMTVLGPSALLESGESEAPLYGNTEHHWRYANASTVAAGSLEIQKMLIARTALGRTKES